MFQIRYARPEDADFWFTWDRHMKRELFQKKTAFHECYVLVYRGIPAGVLRYQLLWDAIPFLGLLVICPDYQRKGLGSYALSRWEAEMKGKGHQLTLTSTMADEQAQHFYRKLGYRDCGCLIKDVPCFRENMEIFMVKSL